MSAIAALERFDGQPPKNIWEVGRLDRTALLVTLVNEPEGREGRFSGLNQRMVAKD